MALELPPVVATLIANTEEFMLSLDKAQIRLKTFGETGGRIGSTAGSNVGRELAVGVDGASAMLVPDLEKTAKLGGDKFAQALKGPIRDFQGLFQSFGGDLPGFAQKFLGVGAAMENAGGSAGMFAGEIAGMGVPEAAAAAAGLALIGISTKMAIDYESATNKIAAASGISQSSAKQITDAFLATSGTTKYAANEIAGAFVGVAGQLQGLSEKPLSVATSMNIMQSSMNLAEGTGNNLTSTTKHLVDIMQAYGVSTQSAGALSDVLFKASEASGLGVDQLTAALTRMHTQLGANAPDIATTSALIVDLTQHGIVGRGAIQAVTQAFNAMAAPNATTKAAMDAAGISFSDASGKLLPMGKILDELQPKIQGMSPAMATAELKSLGFGSASSKLVGVIQSGGPKFDEMRRKILAHGSASDAAEKANSGFKGSMEKALASVKDMGITLGQLFLPVLKDLGMLVGDVVIFVFDTLKRTMELLMPVWKLLYGAIKLVIDTLRTLVHWVETVSGWFGSLTNWLGLTSDAHKKASDSADQHSGALDKISYSSQAAANAQSAFLTKLSDTAEKVNITTGSLLMMEQATGKTGDQIVTSLQKAMSQSDMTAQSLLDLGLQSGSTFDQISQAVKKAGDAAKSSFDSSYDIVSILGSQTNVTGQMISDFYKNSVNDAQTFTSNVRQAIADGYSPSVIADLMTKGPKQAGSILTGLVSNYSSDLVQEVNAGADALTQAGAQAVETARLTQMAVQSKTAQGARDLQTALKIQQQQQILGIGSTIESVAQALNTSLPEIQRINEEYGQGLPDAYTSNEDKAGAAALAQINSINQVLSDPNNYQMIMNQYQTLGGNFIGGITKGVINGQVNLTAAMLQVLDKAATDGAFFAGINSPSKLTRDMLGLPMSEGIAVGLELGVPGVSDAMKRVLGNSVDSNVQKVRNVHQAMRRLGGIDAASNLANSASADISSLVSVGPGGGATVLHVTTPIQIDGQTLAKAVTTYQLRGARSTGTVFGQYGSGQNGYATEINVNAVNR